MSDNVGTESRTFVLCDDVATSTVLDLARHEGWELVEDVPRRHEAPRYRAWCTAEGVRIDLREWFFLGVRTVVVNPAPADPGPTADRLSAATGWQTRQELLDELATDGPDTCRRIMRAVLALPPAATDDPRYLTGYRRTLAHPDRKVRCAALFTAACYLSWPGMRQLLAERQAVETELVEQLNTLLTATAT